MGSAIYTSRARCGERTERELNADLNAASNTAYRVDYMVDNITYKAIVSHNSAEP